MSQQELPVVHPDQQKEESILSGVNFDIEVKEGVVYLTLSHEGADAGAKVVVNLNSDKLLDKLAEKIPGTIDDTIISIIKAALKNVK